MDVAVVAVAARHLDRRHHPLRHRPAHQVGLDVDRRHHQGRAPPDPLEVRDRAQRAVDHVEVDRELSHPRQRVEQRVEVEAKVVEPLVPVVAGGAVGEEVLCGRPLRPRRVPGT